VQQVPLTQEDILHPQEEDFIVQTPLHDAACHYLRSVLRRWADARPNTVVLHDCRIDWGVEGVKPHGPDLPVFEGVTGEWDPGQGTFYPAQVGGRVILVIEVTSPSTRNTDLDEKVLEYYRAGVPFYAIFDFRTVEGVRQVRLLGYRATPEGYVRVPLDAQGRLWLEPVRLWLAVEGDRAVCFDEQGNRIPDEVELTQAIRQADARVEEAHALTEEAVRARQEAEAQAGEAARARQEAEVQAAEAARARHSAEALAADLATQMQQLQAELARLRGQ
jgi:Uma2 family endonuclease